MARPARRSLIVLLAALALAAALPLGAAPEDADADAKLAADRKKSYESFRARCEALINDRNYASRESAHYIVESDDPRFDPKAAADLLESYQGWFDSFWSGRLTLRPHADKSFVFFFYSYYKYRQLLGDAEAAGELRPVGHYMGGVDVVAAHTDTVEPGDLPDVVVHEATHQLFKTRLYGEEAEPSPWIAEGVASYFGFTWRDRAGEFKVGEIGGKEGVVLFPKLKSRPTAAEKMLDAYQARVRKDQAEPIDEVIAIRSESEFFMNDPIDNYAASWLLVHFLLHADGGAHAAGFAAYLKHEIEGKSGPSVFYADIGMERPALVAAFKEYAGRLKSR
ncbi:MAG: DUF1570 domain-containing protein [Acidobacteria bacterium]|nr:DUF1570 domain-containing protein [Acidobacteriota bacterium]